MYFGNGAYGVQAAAKTYFGKAVDQLTLKEGALIAAVIRAPSVYDPFNSRKAALERRNLVLAQMADLGWAPKAKTDRAQQQDLGLHRTGGQARYPAPYFLDYVQRQIIYGDESFDKVGKTLGERTKALFRGGLRIHTTVDLAMQEAAEDAVEQILQYPDDPHAALVAIEPSTGHVKAMVGGRDWFAAPKEDPYAKLNLAILAEPGLGRVRDDSGDGFEKKAPGTGRQAGSAFKPFALAAAVDEGTSLSNAYKADACMDLPQPGVTEPWHVCNYSESGFGNSYSLLEATVFSVNVVYAQLILDVGPEDVVELAEELGITTPLLPVPSAVLGANEVNALGMASAYGTLAAQGEHNPPMAITRITNARGKVLYSSGTDDDYKSSNPIEEGVAYITTTALQQVIERGTAARYGGIGRPAAGKTGTAQEYRDAWFAGYTPDLVAAVWVGYPEGQIEMKPSCGSTTLCRPTRILVTGGSWPTQIWQAFMLRALSGITATAFEVPDIGLVTVTIDSRVDDCLAGPFTPDEFSVEATFVKGTQPKETCRVSEEDEEGGVLVPDVFGFPVDDAVRILEDAGFGVQQVDTPSTTYPPGRVIGQDPEGGSRAPGGATVTINVSVSGQQSNASEVPNVLGMPRSDAERILAESGFNAQVIIQAEADKDDAKARSGLVWKQSPAGGTEAPAGSTVTIWVNP